MAVVLISGGLVAGFLGVSPVRAAAPPPTPHSITGNVWRQSINPGNCVRSSYNAKTDSSGNTSGSLTLAEFPCDSSGQVTGPSNGQLSGTVSCLSLWSNALSISGPVTHATGVLASIGPYFTDTAFDNSTPSSPPNPDTDVLFSKGAVTCSFDSGGQPLISGDVRILY